jgi:RNA polymerase sigma-54 factor
MRTGLVLQPQQKLTQTLVMTPKLQQAIKVMQMTSLELQLHVNQELAVNPFLEEGVDLEEEEAFQNEIRETESDDLEPVKPEMAEPEIRIEDFLDDSLPSFGDDASLSDDEDDRPHDIAREVSFHEYLTDQLRFLRLPPSDLAVVELIIGNIDDDGFLAATVEELAEETGRQPDEIEEILEYVQTHLEPSGVGSRNRQEFFLVQLRNADEVDPIHLALVERHYDDLLKNQLPRIAKELRDAGFGEVTVDDIQRAKESLSRLKLTPAQGFLEGMHGIVRFASDARPITPDVIVEMVDGEYRVRSVEEAVPRVHLNRRYLQLLTSRHLKPEERAWLEDYRQRAKELIESIHERGKTIENVAREIFAVQQGFLEHGVTHLKPLVLRDIAQRLGKHESTISRATKRKYVQTPRGIYEMKFFFSSGLEQDSGESASSTSVRALIQEIIGQEDPSDPLSDDKISQILNDRGIRVARRTVAKYRESLGIPPKHQRKNRW